MINAEEIILNINSALERAQSSTAASVFVGFDSPRTKRELEEAETRHMEDRALGPLDGCPIELGVDGERSICTKNAGGDPKVPRFDRMVDTDIAEFDLAPDIAIATSANIGFATCGIDPDTEATESIDPDNKPFALRCQGVNTVIGKLCSNRHCKLYVFCWSSKRLLYDVEVQAYRRNGHPERGGRKDNVFNSKGEVIQVQEVCEISKFYTRKKRLCYF